jgi:phospholipid/cholesterol/gamma-HCH transport system substrate-binding protein
MRANPTRDLLVGCFVLAGLAAIAYLSLTVGGFSLFPTAGMTLYGSFDETGGLKERAPVVISGVKVGEVDSIELNDDYRARVAMKVDAKLELPVDTSASIVTAGVLGDLYVSLQLGAEEELLKSGDEISFVESAVILERLIGKFIHNAQFGDGKEDEKDGEAGGEGAEK